MINIYIYIILLKMKIKNKEKNISDLSCGNLSFSLSALSVFPHLMVSFC